MPPASTCPKFLSAASAGWGRSSRPPSRFSRSRGPWPRFASVFPTCRGPRSPRPAQLRSLRYRGAGTRGGPPGHALTIQLGGAPESLPERLGRSWPQFVGGTAERFEGDGDAALWQALRPRRPFSGTLLVKVPLTPKAIPELDRQARRGGRSPALFGRRQRRLDASWPGSAAALDALLRELGLAGPRRSAGPADRPPARRHPRGQLPRSDQIGPRSRTVVFRNFNRLLADATFYFQGPGGTARR